MPFAGNQTQIVQIKSIVSGQLCYNTLEYGHTDTGNYSRVSDFGTAWLNAVMTSLLDVMSEDTQVLSVTFSATSPTGVPPYAPNVVAVNLPGNVVSQSLPPYASYRLYKQPDNASFEGTFGTEFRVGMMRVPGVPELWQSGGLLITTATDALDTLAGNLLSLDVPGQVGVGDIFFNMLMVRREVGNPANFGLAPVLALAESNILGTQNSRKIT